MPHLTVKAKMHRGLPVLAPTLMRWGPQEAVRSLSTSPEPFLCPSCVSFTHKRAISRHEETILPLQESVQALTQELS